MIAVILGLVLAGQVLLPAGRMSGRIGPVTVPIQVPAEYRAIVQQAAQRCPRIPADVLAAQIAAESGWDPQARSPVGARGIAQFMPKTWRQYGLDANGDGKASVWDPVDAIHAAAALNCTNLRLIKGIPGDPIANVLAAYNAGHMAVRRYRGIPPYPETEAYVSRILSSARTLTW